MKGMNSLFGLKIQFVVGEELLVAIAVSISAFLLEDETFLQRTNIKQQKNYQTARTACVENIIASCFRLPQLCMLLHCPRPHCRKSLRRYQETDHRSALVCTDLTSEPLNQNHHCSKRFCIPNDNWQANTRTAPGRKFCYRFFPLLSGCIRSNRSKSGGHAEKDLRDC